jgi:hypothetical protein
MNTKLKYILEGDRRVILDSFFIFTKSTVISIITSQNFTYSNGFIKLIFPYKCWPLSRSLQYQTYEFLYKIKFHNNLPKNRVSEKEYLSNQTFAMIWTDITLEVYQSKLILSVRGTLGLTENYFCLTFWFCICQTDTFQKHWYNQL